MNTTPLWLAVLAYVVVHGPEWVHAWVEEIVHVRDAFRRKPPEK